jgi:hypothetical protein
MGEIGFNSDKVTACIITLALGLIAGAILGWYAFGIDMGSPESTSIANVPVAPAQPAAPVVTVVPTPMVTPFQPYVTTFTVVSTTLAYGRYQVLTYDGRTIDVPNAAIWNTIIPRGVYVATVTNTQWGEYVVSDISLMSRPHDQVYTYYGDRYGYDDYYWYSEYPKYYEWDGTFWQCDRNSCDKITYKQAKGENIIHAEPPYW